MKQAFFSAFFVCSLLIPHALAQPEIPEPMGFVNDFAEILSEETESAISALLEQIQTETSAEVAVVTVDSLQDYDSNTFAVELGRSWGVGNSERDDGVVFLTAVADRETYIATGYGVEEYITDAQAYWITSQVVAPYFRDGNYDRGILAGVEQIKKALVDLEALPEGSSSNSAGGFSFLFAFIFIITVVLPWLAAVLGRSKAWWPGGVVGAASGAGFAGLMGTGFWVIIPLALFGFLLDYLASTNFKKGKSKWYTGGGKGGWGGGSSGWGSSSGSSSGSSFGGFSGGSFGGGGGGSSW